MNTQKKSGARRGEAERASEGQFGAAVGLLLGELLKTGARVTAFVSVAVAKFLPGSIATLATVLAASLPTAAQAQPVSDYFNYTRTSAFSYDSNGLLVSETVEPDLQQVQCLTTTYTYDGWGNKNSATTASCLPSAAFEYFDPRRTLSLSNGAPAVNALAIPAGSAMTVSVNGVVVTVPAGTFMRQTLNALSHSEVRDIDPRFGVPVKLTGPNALDTSWTLDGFGRVVLEIRADGTRIKTNYCYFSITEISANSVDCPAIFLTVTGAEVPALAVYGVQTQQFDASGTAQGAYSRVYHDRVGRKLRTVTQAFDGTRSLVQDNDYNEFGAVVISTQPYFLDSGRSVVATGSSDYGMSRTVYDALGRSVEVNTIDPAGNQNGLSGSNNPQISYGSRRGPSISTKTTIAYEGLRTTTTQVLTPAANVTRIEEKNPDGKLVRVTDTLGAQLLHQHDAFGNLIYTRDALQKVVAIDYDVRGRKLVLNDPDTGRTVYCYDALGQLKAQQTANQRTSVSVLYVCPTNNTSGAGSTAPVTNDPGGSWTSFGYDQLGRMRQRIEPGDYKTDWLYDIYAGNGACNKGIGKLCEVLTDNNVRRRYAYDSLGRPQNSRVDILLGNNQSTIERSAASAVTYNAEGRLASQTYPTGVTVNYGYTALGYLSTVSTGTKITVGGRDINGASVLWQALSVNAWGRTESASMPSTVPAGSSNPLTNWASFEPATGRISSQQSGASQITPTAVNLSYTWNSLNLLTARIDNIGILGTPTNDTFTYDSLGRLTSYVVTGQGITGRTVNLTYNAVGMLLNKTDVGAYSYPPAGSANTQVHTLQSVSGPYNANYAYDKNGNLISQSGTGAGVGGTGGTAQPAYTALTYSSFNMVKSINSDAGSTSRPYYTYQYDENHQRIKEVRKFSNVTRTTYYLHPDNQGGLAFEREEIGTTAANRHFLSAGGQVFAVLVTSGDLPAPTGLQPLASIPAITALKLEYWNRDHIGSLVATSDHNGALVARFAYDPFGKRRNLNATYDPFGTLIIDWNSASPNTGPDRGFTGHEHLDDVGIVNMNGRVFDPLVARFMQADPFIQDPTNLQSFDRYAYCANNPGSCTDPTGYLKIFGHYVTAKDIKTVVAIVVAIYAPYALEFYGQFAAGTFVTAGSTVTLTGAATAGFISGAISGGSLKSAIQGAFSAAVFYGAGDVIERSPTLGREGAIALHGVAGCVSSVAGGGKCGPGALSAAFSKAALPFTAGFDDGLERAMAHAVIGGTGSVLGGGKFANGAMTGSFSYLFNYCMHNGCTPTESGNSRDRDGYGRGDFGVSRDGGARRHEGMDFITAPGEEIQAPIGGVVKRVLYPYAGDTRLTGVEIVNEAGQSAKIFYVNPLSVAIGMRVDAGDVIGYAQDLHVKYNQTMTNHVHVEIRVSGKVVNPYEFMRDGPR